MWDAVQDRKKRILSTLLLLGATGVFFLYQWVLDAEVTAHVIPQAERQEIGEIVEKAQQGGGLRTGEKGSEVSFKQGEGLLSSQDIMLLCEQTGLGEDTIKELWQQGRLQELLTIQKIYFAPVEIEAIKTTPLTISEWLAEEPVPGYKGMPLMNIRNGDILITKNSRFLGWRNGHVGLVVNAEEGLVLEAIMLGSPSQLCKIGKWESYPSFLVLRLKEEFMISQDGAGIRQQTENTTESVADGSVAAKVAAYATEHLVGVPYQLLAGVFKGESYEGEAVGDVVGGAEVTSEVEVVAAEALSGTQCAHLVWYAYKQYGIDLDSDGGFLVTPYDIQNSPYLEVVQSYGY